MNITASDLQNKDTGGRMIKYQTNIILKTIQSEIKEANSNGMYQVITPIPTNFNIPGMLNTDSQAYIYHNVLKELEDRGFRVRINMGEGIVSFCVSWGGSVNHEHINRMIKVIAQHTIKTKSNKTSLQQFRDRRYHNPYDAKYEHQNKKENRSEKKPANLQKRKVSVPQRTSIKKDPLQNARNRYTGTTCLVDPDE